VKRIFCAFCLVLGLSGFPLFSQNSGEQPDADQVFIINTISFNTKGRTRPDAILHTCEIKEGEEIHGQANLEKYIQNKTQILLNQRVLQKAQIDYTAGERRGDGKYPVDLLISVEDTWNFIILPKPQFSSNTGYELTLKGRDYNFLGTMNPLRIDLGYKYDEKKQSSILFEIDSDTPFKAFGYNWSINFDHFFNYRPDAEEPYYYKNVTGLSMELPFKTTTFTFGLEESFILNEENAERDKPFYGSFQNGLYMSSHPYVIWKIPVGLEIGNYGELAYTPKITATFNHEFPQWPLDEIRKGPSLNFSQSLGFNQVNWIGNYRQGFDVSMDNSYGYDFHRRETGKEALSIDYSVSGIGHFIVTDDFGVSAYLRYRHWFYHDPEYYDQAGDALRGILDRDIHADYMLSLNLDFPVRILHFAPSEWFGKPKLQFFDFDMHLSPIVDMALYHDPEKNTAFDFKNMLASGGFEVIVFPAFIRSLYVRLSFAWNFVEQINNPNDYYLNPVLPIVPHFPSGGNREIFFGIGHHY
jgi:hypothetical protein